MLTQEILEELRKPFPEEAIEWKPQRLWPKDNPTKALAVPFIKARHVMDRLDEVVGPANWEHDFDELPSGSIKSKLTVLGITKCDRGFVAGEDDKGLKGSVSDGLKRAAVHFGIGRYLYDAEAVWVDWDDKHKKFAQEPQLTFKEGREPEAAKDKPEQPMPPASPGLQKQQEEGRNPNTLELITKEADAMLVAAGLGEHYKHPSHTFNAIRQLYPDQKIITDKWLAENEGEILQCLYERVATPAEEPEEEQISF